ncbi:MAG: hypothetical protein BWY32_03775 [bacterium ADurb.Bin243]|nr:MAG: hypothetical protein BWY32_03775 [bacterium ADurb.Bin243]
MPAESNSHLTALSSSCCFWVRAGAGAGAGSALTITAGTERIKAIIKAMTSTVVFLDINQPP